MFSFLAAFLLLPSRLSLFFFIFLRATEMRRNCQQDYHVKHNYVPPIMKLHGMQIKVDFAKALDKVPHQLLMKKLSEVPNISSQILMWMHNFLKDRRQKVVINGQCFSELPVTSGVP